MKEEFVKGIYEAIPIIGFAVAYFAIKDNVFPAITTTDFLIVVGFAYMTALLKKVSSISNSISVFHTWCIVNAELLKSMFGNYIKDTLNENK